MNKIYKVIYNKSLQMYQVVSELAKGQGKVNVSKRFRQGRINAEKAFLTAIVIGVLSSTVTFAAGVVNNGDTITGGTNVTVNETGTMITVGLDPAVATDAEVTAAVNALASGQVATNQADIATLKTTTTQQGTAIGNLQSADTNLQNQITANKTANDTKNSQQDTTIAANKSASEAADTALSNRINTINTLNTTLGLDVTKPGLKYFRANSTEADAIAGGTNSIAVGPKAETKANAERSVAIGYDSTARAAESVVIGDHATSQGSANKSVAIGNAARTGSNTEGGDTTMDGAGSPVLGDGTSAIAVGDSSIARGERVIAIGKGAATYNRDAESRFSFDSMAIGTDALVIAADNAIALGKNAKIAKNADSSVAIGDTAVSSGKRAVALGVGATAGGVSSLALGDGANSTQDNAVAIGKGSKADQTDTVAIGDNAKALTTKTISIGLNAGAGQAADATGTKHSHINIGENAGANVNGQYNIGIGYNAGSGVSGKASIAMGVEAGKNLTNQPETETDNVSIGNKANSYASATSIEKAVAIGAAVKAQTGSVGIGYETNAQGKQAVALGFQASTTGDQGVAVGYSAKADANNVALGSNSVATMKEATGYLTGMASKSVVSVGSKDTNTMRRIVNVADGADDQDAATVAQLKKVKDKVLADVNTAINKLPTNQNTGITYDAVNSSSTTADASISLKNDTGKGTRISNVSNPVTDMDAVNLQTLKAAVKEGQPKYFSANNQGGDYGNADNANATGKRSLAIGQTVQATAENSVAVGNDANAYGIGSIAIGSKYVGNAALDDGVTNLSSDTSVSKKSQDYRYGIAIGAGAITEGNNSLAIGSLASVTNQNIATGTVDRGVAVGYRARSSADKANAIGDRAIASGKMASAMGSESLAAGTSSIAIGTKAQTGAENDIAIGTNQSVTGKNSGSIGYAGLETDANKTVITGKGTYSLGNTNSRVVGAESGIFGNSNSINAVTNVRVVGNTNKIGEITPASGAQAPDPNTATPVTYLKDIYVNGYNNKISSGSKLAKDLSGMFVLGHDNEVANITDPNAPGELAITDSTVIGARNKVNTEGASYFVLGNDVTATLANSVYLGSKSAYTVKGASTAGNTKYASEVLNGQARNFAGGTNLAGVVTVGAPGAERRIQNVGAGLINATSTDAINGSQLYQYTLPLRFAGDNSTIGSTAAADVNVIKRASDQAMSILGGATNLSDNNIGVVADAATNKMTVKLSKELKNLTSVQTVNGTKTTTMTGDGTTVKDGANVTTVTAAGTTVTKDTKTVTLAATGLDNGNNQIVNVASGLGGTALANASGTTLTNAANISDLKTAITNLDTTLTNKGTRYGGDAGTAFVTPLGEQTNIKGGVTDPSKLSDGNIGVVADATTKTLNVKLAKDLQGLNSVTTTTADGKTNVMNGTGNTIKDGTKVTTVTAGSTTVKDGKNVTTISSTGTTVTDGNKTVTVTANGLDNGGNKVVNVASGLDGGTLETASGSTLTNAANIKDLKTAVNSITDAGFGLKDEAGNVINQKLGTAIQVTGDSNIDTKVVDAVDANGAPTGGKALQVSLNNELEIGKAGADGKDGKIGVNGKDGSGVVINGKDGSIGLNGANGANGLTIKGADGKAGVDGAPGETKTRITYEYKKPDGTTGTEEVGTEEVATLNDGMKYGGDLGTGGDASKQVIKKKLNEQVNVVGGITDMNEVADVPNIAVIADGTDNLTLRLAKDLQGLTSVTTTTPDGKTNVMNGTGNTMTDGAKVNTVTAAGTTITDGTKKVTLTADGLNNGGNQITNVASGYAPGETIHNVSDVSKSNAATIGDLTKVVDKNVGGFGLIDKDGTEYKEDLGKSIKVTGDDNINTKFIDYTTTENGQQVTKKALQVSLADDITIGKPGADGKDGKITVTGKDGNAVVIDGKDGKIGVNGKDGSGVVINGKDGSIGLNGANGANGLTIKGADGKAGVDGAPGETKTRITYEYKKPDGTTGTEEVGTEEVATLNDGMKYGGDLGTGGDASKQVIKKKLNEQVNVVGGITDMNEVADVPNIAVIADGTDNLTLRLAKDLQGLTSVTTTTPDGKTNVMNGTGNTMTDHDKVNTVTAAGTTITDGTKTVTLTADGLNNGGNQITNVASGYAPGETIHNVSDVSKSNAATIGDLTKVVDKNVGGFGLIDKDGTEYKEDLGKSIKVTGDDNINTKFIDYTTTENGQQVTKKALQVSLADDITIGKPGADGKDGKITVTGKDGNAVVIDGKDGKIGVNGKDGSGVVINGKDGSIGLNGANGANGLTIKGADGKAGVDGAPGETKTRITYEYKKPDGTTGTEEVGTEEVATLNDGMKYGGDLGTGGDASKQVIKKKLNEQVNVVGGITDMNEVADVPNIAVIADGTDNLTLRLAKDLQGLTSVTTTTPDGKTNVMNGTGNTMTDHDKVNTVTAAGTTITDGTKTVTLTADGLNNGGNQITNVASGYAPGETIHNVSDVSKSNAATIGDLTKVVDKNVGGFGLIDKDGTEYKEDLGKSIKVTGDDNINTKFIDYTTTENGQQVTKKALQVSLADDITIGKPGADGKDGKITVTGKDGNAVVIDGKDGKIGVNGKDGSGVVINGKDGSIGLNGANGANGLTIKGADGKAGVDGAPGETKTRITYEYKKPDGTTGTEEVGTEEVATLNDGMKYGGDLGTGGDASKQVIKKKLNEQVNVVGGITDMNEVADVPNIAVIADGTDNLTLRLAKDLQGLTSVTTTTPDGKTNVMNGTGNTMTDHDKVNTVTAAGTTITDGTKTVTLTADGLNNGGNQITNVASGYAPGETIHNVSDVSKSNAATIGDLTKVVDKNVGGFGLIDKDGTEYKEDLGKSIKVTGDDNINTKFIDYTTTENGQQVTKKALQVSLADDITIGKPGADGKDGKITVTGKDGNAVVIDGKDGAVGATGANGASAVLNGKDGSLGLTGPNGKNGISIKGDQGPAGVNGADDEMKTRMVYEYKDAFGQPVKETVATLNDGMKYGGDTGTNLAMKLNEKVNIVGGITDESKLAQDPNIGVVADGTDTLKIKLAKNLKGLESVQTGDTTMNSDGLTIINGPSITKTGIDAGDMNITNVAPGLIGPNSKDAINGSQLWDTNQKVSKLGNQINRVGAGAAALSALHPLDFDPDDKWDITAGYGNYKNAHALALGTFYRPNESTMFSLGASIGGGENMVNAGISVKLGQGNNVTTSRVAMAKEIIDLRDDNKELRKQVEEINNRLNSLLGILDMNKRKDFPDVPDNHWAYNYVATLAGNGLVEGYPDGTFAGDRTMTRYEFAAIIYRALKNGAPVDENMDRAMNEFEPELRQIRLDRIRVDRISGNDTDKYKVERVRVNNKDNEEKNDYRDIYGGSIPKPIVETEIAE